MLASNRATLTPAGKTIDVRPVTKAQDQPGDQEARRGILEHRRIRTDIRIRTCIETEFAVRGRRAQGQIRNVSEGGLFVSTASVPEEGESVDLTFRAPGGEEVSLSGLVRWTTHDRFGKRHRIPGFGLRLLDESDAFRSLLASL